MNTLEEVKVVLEITGLVLGGLLTFMRLATRELKLHLGEYFASKDDVRELSDKMEEVLDLMAQQNLPRIKRPTYLPRDL